MINLTVFGKKLLKFKIINYYNIYFMKQIWITKVRVEEILNCRELESGWSRIFLQIFICVSKWISFIWIILRFSKKPNIYLEFSKVRIINGLHFRSLQFTVLYSNIKVLMPNSIYTIINTYFLLVFHFADCLFGI